MIEWRQNTVECTQGEGKMTAAKLMETRLENVAARYSTGTETGPEK